MNSPTPAREEIRLESVLHALSEPMRMRVVRELAAADGELSCSRFVLPVTKSTTTHHFRVLRESGVIRQVYRGTAKMNGAAPCGPGRALPRSARQRPAARRPKRTADRASRPTSRTKEPTNRATWPTRPRWGDGLGVVSAPVGHGPRFPAPARRRGHRRPGRVLAFPSPPRPGRPPSPWQLSLAVQDDRTGTATRSGR